MGTYTTNKNLFIPTVGETGWGTLVNGNFETIDNFLKPITVSGSTYIFTGSHVGNQSGGSVSATSITNSGTSTFTGKITANGGIGTTSLTTSSTITSTGKITSNGGIGTTTLTTSSTITSTGLIAANGGVKGNLTGNVTATDVTATNISCSGKLKIPFNTSSGLLMQTLCPSGDINCSSATNKVIGTINFTKTMLVPSNTSFNFSVTFKVGFGHGSYTSDIPSINLYNVTDKVVEFTQSVSSGTYAKTFTIYPTKVYQMRVSASGSNRYINSSAKLALYI